MAKTPIDYQRLFEYVEQFFFRAKTKEDMWPTVRMAARSLGWTQVRVEGAIDDDPDRRLFLSGYNHADRDRLGSMLIESFGDEAPI